MIGLESIPYSDHVGVVAFLQAAQRTITARPVMNTIDQFDVRNAWEGDCQIKAEVEEHPGAACMVNLMQGFLSDWTGYGAKAKHESRRNANRVEQRDEVVLQPAGFVVSDQSIHLRLSSRRWCASAAS